MRIFVDGDIRPCKSLYSNNNNLEIPDKKTGRIYYMIDYNVLLTASVRSLKVRGKF